MPYFSGEYDIIIEDNRIIATESALDPAALFAKLQKDNAGSIIFHYTVVKNEAGWN